jgi:hypothetical protein
MPNERFPHACDWGTTQSSDVRAIVRAASPFHWQSHVEVAGSRDQVPGGRSHIGTCPFCSPSELRAITGDIWRWVQFNFSVKWIKARPLLTKLSLRLPDSRQDPGATRSQRAQVAGGVVGSAARQVLQRIGGSSRQPPWRRARARSRPTGTEARGTAKTPAAPMLRERGDLACRKRFHHRRRLAGPRQKSARWLPCCYLSVC